MRKINLSRIAVSILAAGLLGISGARAQSASGSDGAADLLAPATRSYSAGEYKKALRELDEAGKKGADSDKIRYMRGLCHLKQNQLAVAKKELSWLYYNAGNKTVRYKAWEALRSMGKAQAKPRKQSIKTAHKYSGEGAWITPQQGYGRTGPAPSSNVEITRYHNPACGR